MPWIPTQSVRDEKIYLDLMLAEDSALQDLTCKQNKLDTNKHTSQTKLLPTIKYESLLQVLSGLLAG